MREREPTAMSIETVVTIASEHQIVTERVFDAPREWVEDEFDLKGARTD